MLTQIENPENKENESNNNNIASLSKAKPSTHRNDKVTENKIAKKNKVKAKSLIIPKKKLKKIFTNNYITPPRINHNSKQKEIFLLENHYFNQENTLLFLNYGNSIFDDIKKREVGIPSSLLKTHSISSSIHLKMIDWMIEVLSVYRSSEETFFLAIKIMDLYISKAQNIKSGNIHLIGVTSMFIASKFEDVYPISLSMFTKNIGHNQFTQKAITEEERKILSAISIDNLITSTMHDYIKIIFFDFETNNQELIKKVGIDQLCSMMKKVAMYLIKMILHFEYFYNYADSVKAIACIMTALSILKAQTRKLTPEHETLFLEWVQIIMKESEHPIELLINLYMKISDCYENFHLLNTISQNLNRFFPLKLK